ncbi:hypothetical protein, partial [Mesorhizobium wenxiniae]|uniref:hypothetical protein n=1 Tax=Mesorhizobium wenxiniae TaxID=2014805 RepID=UPI00197F54F4
DARYYEENAHYWAFQVLDKARATGERQPMAFRNVGASLHELDECGDYAGIGFFSSGSALGNRSCKAPQNIAARHETIVDGCGHAADVFLADDPVRTPVSLVLSIAPMFGDDHPSPEGTCAGAET